MHSPHDFAPPPPNPPRKCAPLAHPLDAMRLAPTLCILYSAQFRIHLLMLTMSYLTYYMHGAMLSLLCVFCYLSF